MDLNEYVLNSIKKIDCPDVREEIGEIYRWCIFNIFCPSCGNMTKLTTSVHSYRPNKGDIEFYNLTIKCTNLTSHHCCNAQRRIYSECYKELSKLFYFILKIRKFKRVNECKEMKTSDILIDEDLE